VKHVLKEAGHNGNLSLAENVYSLKDPDSSTCMKRKLPATKKTLVPCGSVTGEFHCVILYYITLCYIIFVAGAKLSIYYE
jgi:hypothetical protein